MRTSSTSARGACWASPDLQNPATLSPPGNWSYQSSLYALVDNGTSLGNPRSNATIVHQTISASGSTQFTITNNPVSIPTNIGWYVDFPASGERINVNPVLDANTLIVPTNIPPNSSACSAGGDSVTYELNPATGSALSDSGGVAGTKNVGSMIVGISTYNTCPTCGAGGGGNSQGAGGGSAFQPWCNTGACGGGGLGNGNNTTLRRVGWREVPQ